MSSASTLMDPKPFGVNLKPTGKDPVRGKSFSAASSTRTARATASIHTPLKPANVHDLKAMFDHGKTGSETSSSNSSVSSTSGTNRSGQSSPRSGTSSHARSAGTGSNASSLEQHGGSAKRSESKSLAIETKSTDLGSDAKVTSIFKTSTSSVGSQRTKSEIKSNKSNIMSASNVSFSSVASNSSRDSIFPSRVNFPVSATPGSLSRTDSKSVGSKLGDKKHEQSPSESVQSLKSKGKVTNSAYSKTTNHGFQTSGQKSFEKKPDSTERRTEINVQHIISTKSIPSSSTPCNKIKLETKNIEAERVTGTCTSTTVKSFQMSSSSSRPMKNSVSANSDKLLNSSDQSILSSISSNNNKPSSHAEAKKIIVEQLPSAPSKGQKVVGKVPSGETEKEFQQVKLRSAQERKLEPKIKSSNPVVSDPKVLFARKMSNERFERLKFDFERGVGTENRDHHGLSTTDHIELQNKARELRGSKEEEEANAERIKQEESIFAKGLKVSDFVKQINITHPPPKEAEEAGKKWKVNVKSHRITSESESRGENEYIEMPDEVSGDEGIYEFVAESADSGKANNTEDANIKLPGRRHGVYRKKASLKKKKSESTSSKEDKKETVNSDVIDSQDIVLSSGEDEWETDQSSTSTNYEPMDDDNFYEDPEVFDALDKKNKKKEDKEAGQSLSDKFKKNMDKALNKIGTKFNKKKTKESEVSVSVVPVAGADPESDVMEEVDGIELSPLSRTSSERSSGRLTKSKEREVAIEVPKVMVEGEEKDLISPPPPLPPRASKIIAQVGIENSPPLPPRNPLNSGSSLGVNTLDLVVPITPPIKRHSMGDNKQKSDRFSFGKESLASQEMQAQSSDTTDYPEYELAKTESYLDYDPASPLTIERIERKDKGSSTASRISGPYMYPDNISDWPQLHGDSGDDDDLYIELEDDQIYGQQERLYTTKFKSEPLYQWYAKDKLIRSHRQLSSTSDISGEEAGDSDDENIADDQVYEDVERLLHRSSTRKGRPDSFERNAPARRSVIMDVFSKSGSLHRALWCEMPEVISSGVLNTMDPQEKKIQESMFEIMTSEASYQKSLNVLINVFLKAPEFSTDMNNRSVITKRERQYLFSNIGTIRDISAKFLADLEIRWQQSCIMDDICDIVAKHAEKNFDPYIRYCSNQAYQERTLEAMQKRSDFLEAIKRLEQNPECQYLPMSSFLLLPMQRITRLPLLVDTIRHRLDPGIPRHISASKALEKLNRIVRQCNDGAKKMLQTEQICLLAANLEFKIKEFPLVSASRHLVKQGELTRTITESTSRIPFGKGWLGSGKEHVYLFLFNDILLVTKKRGNIYQVRDYCQRNSLHAEALDSGEKSRNISQVALSLKNMFLLVLLSNHENKQVEMILSSKSESERTRWLDALEPRQVDPEHERIYEDWDCPQVQCVEKYIAQEPDELTLEESDVINVYKKISDGWYEGERIRDGERGWFPASCTEEINNSHVRARNLRLRYRLMIASKDFTNVKNTN